MQIHGKFRTVTEAPHKQPGLCTGHSQTEPVGPDLLRIFLIGLVISFIIPPEKNSYIVEFLLQDPDGPRLQKNSAENPQTIALI
jgi:hypothetical protein